MCDPVKRSVPLDLHDEQLEELYNGISPVIETSIFAEMEHVMTAIRTSCDAVIDRECENTELMSYMRNDKNFKRFITHVVTNYQSLQEQRINILMVHNKAYQRLEDRLCGEVLVSENGYQKAYQLHSEILLAFHDGDHKLMFAGTMLDTDEKEEGDVIELIRQRDDLKIREMVDGDEKG